MMQSFHFHGLLFLVLLLSLSSFSTTAGRLLLPKQGEKEVNLNGFPQNNPILGLEDSTWKLMGVEDCQSGDEEEEECLKRRMIAEAHLDYIYTQHHKP